jgi:hypothetical protein
MSYNDLLLYENPRRRHKRRNPAKGFKAAAKKMTFGADLTDIAAGTAGMAVAFLVPPYVIKPVGTAPLTNTQKWMKVGVSAAAAVATAFLTKYVAPGSSKAVIIGGAAGVVAQALATFGIATLKPSGGISGQVAGPRPASIAPGRYPADAYSSEFQGVKLD